MARSRPAILIVSAGLLTFVVFFTLLAFSPLAAAPSQTLEPSQPAVTPMLAIAPDSLAPRVQAGQLAVGMPVGGSELLLRDVQPGDRLDILASLAASRDAQPVTAIVVRGATVLRSPTVADPLLLEVSAPDALVLSHLVLGGTHLGYVVTPADSSRVKTEVRLLDEQTARALLGLTTSPTPSSTQSPPATPQPRAGSGFLYQVQPGDTWTSVAATFGLTVERLRQWNEAAPDEDTVPGRLLIIPRSS